MIISNNFLDIDKDRILSPQYNTLSRESIDNEISSYMMHESYLALQELGDWLDFACQRYTTASDASELIALQENTKQSLIRFIDKLNNEASDAWKRLKSDNIDSQISSVLNRESMIYYNTGFRMKFPVGFEAPIMNKWYDFCENCKPIEVNTGNFNTIAKYLNDESDFFSHFYKKYYSENEDFKTSVKNTIFANTEGTEVIAKKEILEYVNFLGRYKSNLQKIENDIDIINRNTNNIRNIIEHAGSEEIKEMAFENREYILEVGFQVKGVQVQTVNNGVQIQHGRNHFKIGKNSFSDVKKIERKEKNIEFNKSLKNKEKNSKKFSKQNKQFITNYFMGTMELLDTKIKLCDKVRKQSIKILKHYKKLQPANIAKKPLDYNSQQQNPAVNPNAPLQIKK